MLAAAAPPGFGAWENFYVIVGSSAGALAGLQFVVMTLIAEGRVKGGMHEVSAFGTPTIVHFCIALLIAAIASSPSHFLTGPVVALVGVRTGWRALHPERYASRAASHALRTGFGRLDLVRVYAIGCLSVSAGSGDSAHPLCHVRIVFHRCRFAGIIALGIRNAWDTVTFVAVQHAGKAGGGTADVAKDRRSRSAQPAK